LAYATQADLLNQMTEQELIQLTDDAGNSLVDAAKVTDAIKAADATIDAYAGARYTLPLQTSEKVRHLSMDIAIYELEKRRRRIREDTQKAYDAAIAFLKDLSAGRAVLDQPSGQPAQTSELDVKVPDDKGVFSDENLEGF